ncbi:PREDICTED: glycine-rich RNA-binding protein 3, mitochondrial-like isoform X2 [Camelina sativa]|uniref:Glycine-rich RNA-binding protein 3, mitochondrial-like isoform X2 n=1 Tax=Camelina sativa TaxID=90675 RepID=A0ABM0XZ49_CAMSA|nr:PREDICTED: glycine-rich RNA-binding protein 3, mitochondrial-like isoform X2 [Camelina sativa]XP_010493076.1 PREDICTED: glycine-rich RNA-binding protein 3, mitochondrial-like isoform X2 [Camelina sativa]XP_010493077.1 PREDICTED: glycine-rich RNA-binding protein 3, mitochondrial-like isoform X2 [Camelina sativa]
MTFLSKFGNILKQTTSKQLNGQVSLSSPSLFQAIRCMSSSKLFIGGMAYSMDKDSLREAFTKYGEVVESYGGSGAGGYGGDATGHGAAGGYGASSGYGSSGNTYGEVPSATAGAVGDYNGSSGYGSANTYGSNNGGFAGDSQFGGNPVANSSQFGGDNTQFAAGSQFGGEDQFGSMEKSEIKMENGPVEGDFEDDTDVAKRA